jgi:hypothetical protein
MTFGVTLQPFYGATAAYASTIPDFPANATLAEASAAGIQTPEFTASFGIT